MAGSTSTSAAPGPVSPPIQAVPVRHPGRWVTSAVVVVLAAMFVHSVTVSTVVRGGQRQSRFQWDVIGHYLLSGPVLDGVVITIELTVIAMMIGIVLGIGLAVMRLSPNPIVSTASWLYIWFFRGTPVLVQLLFWYDIAYLYPSLSLGIPLLPSFVHLNSNTLITPFAAAIFGLGFNEAAYMAEIVRAGILSVDEGQTDAAQALGMTRLGTMRRIVLPQASRVIIPPLGNETISMLKTSSLVSVVSVVELLLLGGERLQPHVPDGASADGGQHLVPVHDLGADGRPVLPGTAFRPGRRPGAAADPASTPPPPGGVGPRLPIRSARPAPARSVALMAL